MVTATISSLVGELNKIYQLGYFLSEEEGIFVVGVPQSFEAKDVLNSCLVTTDKSRTYVFGFKDWGMPEREKPLSYTLNLKHASIPYTDSGVLSINLKPGEIHFFKNRESLTDFLEKKKLPPPPFLVG